GEDQGGDEVDDKQHGHDEAGGILGGHSFSTPRTTSHTVANRTTVSARNRTSFMAAMAHPIRRSPRRSHALLPPARAPLTRLSRDSHARSRSRGPRQPNRLVSVL